MRSRPPSSRFAFALVLACAAFAATGCQVLPKAQPDPTRYYLLSTPSLFTTREFTPPEVQVRLGLHRVGLPAYLATTPNLVVRRGDNEISYPRQPLGRRPLRRYPPLADPPSFFVRQSGRR